MLRQVTSEQSCSSSEAMEGPVTVATIGAEMSIILTAVTLMPRELHSTKVGIPSEFIDSCRFHGSHRSSPIVGKKSALAELSCKHSW